MDCKAFLQKALPVLNRRWAGYRKVKNQVCKRIKRRIRGLELAGFEEYWQYLQDNPGEWKALDACCDITISRFYRDHDVYDYIKDEILPDLVESIKDGTPFGVWSAGCCSGEEPYTLALISTFVLSRIKPESQIHIVATDVNGALLKKAKKGCYQNSSLRELPEEWKQAAFESKGKVFCLKTAYKKHVEFLQQDIRTNCPKGSFKLILCRNLVAMYFNSKVQLQVYGQIGNRLETGGYLVLGKHEILPSDLKDFELVHPHFRVYRKR